MDNAHVPAQTNLEVANATPPVRVNLSRARSAICTDIPRQGGVEQSQSGNEIKTFQGGNESVSENLRASNAPDLLFH